MTTLNGLPRDWESFIIVICSRIKLIKSNKLWEECMQEEGRNYAVIIHHNMKKQLEAIGEMVKEGEFIITTLNGLLRYS